MESIHTIRKRNVFVLLFCLMVIIGIVSCYKEVELEFEDVELEGDISKYVPNDVYDLGVRNVDAEGGVTYLQIEPTAYANFGMWGLKVKKMDFLVDGQLVSSFNKSPYICNYKDTDMKNGTHEAKVLITIGGNKCDDVVIEKKDTFYVARQNSVRKADVYLDYNYVGKGDILKVTPEILPRNASSKTSIKKVEYKWDGVSLSAETSSTFVLSHPIKEEVGTGHILEVKISYSVDGKTTTEAMAEYIKICSDDETTLQVFTKPTRNAFKNTEDIQFVAKSYKGKNASGETELTIFWDEQQITTSTAFPYTFTYKLSGEQEGIHKVTYQMKSSTKENTITKYYAYYAVTY